MNSNFCRNLSKQIKIEAERIGFSACGIARADCVDSETRSHFIHWLNQENHAEMKYMENHLEKRLDPRLLVENARSIISVILNYCPTEELKPDQYQFAWYAYGKDYHEVMKEKLQTLYHFICSKTAANGRVFCDTAPILERYWAQQAGLGWIGKHTQLVRHKAGSCFFLGEIILDVELSYDTPQKSMCGSCMHCIEVCPTGAITPHQLNASKCLSYLTIENRGDIPEKYISKMGNSIYGCDRCLKACPWSNFTLPSETTELHPTHQFMDMQKKDWDTLTEEQYKGLFKDSAVKRTKYEGLMRNIRAAQKNSSEE